MTRLKKLQERLQNLHLDAFLVDDSVNLYYLTGLDLSAGKLLVHAQGASLIVDGRYFESCSKIKGISAVLQKENSLETFLKEALPAIKNLGFCKETTSYQSYLTLQQVVETVTFSSRGQRTISLVPSSNIVAEMRVIKEKQEINNMWKAAALAYKGYDYVRSILKEGITEKEVAAALEIFWLQNGGEGVAFDPIIAFGVNSSMPHYRAGQSKLRQGQHVLIDIGVTLNHYQSDMTRVEFFGKPDPEIAKLYGLVQEAQKEALALCRPGTKIIELDIAARSYLTKKGFGENFTHSLGHGIGLEVHEMPTLRSKIADPEQTLQQGMFVTIEPGIYLSGKGGVRFEDTIEITSSGYDIITVHKS